LYSVVKSQASSYSLAWCGYGKARNQRRRIAMGEAVSRGQALQVAARVAMQVNWDNLDGDRLQEDIIQLTPEEFGERFTAFLKNGGRFIFGDPKLVQTKPFDPSEFFDEGWMIWKGSADGDGLSGEEDMDKQSVTFSKIELASLLFETCLGEGEGPIKGEEKLRRLKEKPLIRLDGTVFMGLWLDYQANKENSVLEFLYRSRGITYMDFFGLVLRRPVGDRGVLCLCRYASGEWRYRYRWLEDDWSASGVSAVLAS